MRKFKISAPQKLTAAIRSKVAQVRPAPHPSTPVTDPQPTPLVDYDKAFPPHLRGTISGCCDNMADGHG